MIGENELSTLSQIDNSGKFFMTYLRAVSKAFMIGQYLLYQLRAQTRFELHSPFLFDISEQVINDRRHYYAFDELDHARTKLLADNTAIEVTDFGAGSHVEKGRSRKVKAIAASSLITPRFGELLFKLCQLVQPATILEMGTSLGISAAYLAKGAPQAKVITLEGSAAIANIARNQWKSLQINNISGFTGEFSSTLPQALAELDQVDLAFIDGNHRLQPTLDYFEQLKPKLHSGSIVIFDDIYWSREMAQAWKTIRTDPMVTVSIDLFYKGIVAMKPEFRQPVHLTLRS